MKVRFSFPAINLGILKAKLWRLREKHRIGKVARKLVYLELEFECGREKLMLLKTQITGLCHSCAWGSDLYKLHGLGILKQKN